jgi:hypothetical protein
MREFPVIFLERRDTWWTRNCQTDQPPARIPEWEDYRADFLAGVPLLSSADAAVDLVPGSLHLDLIAHDRGLKRLAASLYEFEPARDLESRPVL